MVPRCRLSAARCGGIAVYLPKLAMPNSAGVASSNCAPLHPAPEVWDTSSEPPCPTDTADDCNKPVGSSQAWLPHDAETGEEGVSRARSSISLQHLYLPGGLQANALLPGGSLVGLGIRLAARCVGEKLLPLPTCRLFPCCLSVNGPLNSKPPEERRGGRISGYVCTCKTNSPRAFPGTAAGLSPWEFLALPWYDFGLGQLALIQAIFAHGLGISLGQGQCPAGSGTQAAHLWDVFHSLEVGWSVAEVLRAREQPWVCLT